MPNPIGKAFGGLLNPIVECVDVDGVVSRIEIDQLVERIDINKLIDRIDLNRQLDRVNIDALLKRVDVNDLILRSDLGSIIAQSTTGVFSQLFDVLRTQLVLLDLLLVRLARATRGKIRDNNDILPSQPGKRAHLDRVRYPKKSAEKAVVVQGRYTGFVSKAVAILIDVVWITLSFAAVLILAQLCWVFFVGNSKEEAQSKVQRDATWAVIAYCCYWFFYFFLTILLFQRTLGMAIVGAKVADAGGDEDLHIGQVFVRTALLPITLTLFPPLGLLGFWRRDGRMIHDLAAGTGLVYSWDAFMAAERRKAAERMRQRQREQMEASSEGSSSSSAYQTFDDALSRHAQVV